MFRGNNYTLVFLVIISLNFLSLYSLDDVSKGMSNDLRGRMTVVKKQGLTTEREGQRGGPESYHTNYIVHRLIITYIPSYKLNSTC